MVVKKSEAGQEVIEIIKPQRAFTRAFDPAVSEAQEAKRLRDENARLKKLVADLSLDKEALQSVIEKNGWSSQR
jgi:hypothetical protein